MKKIALSFCLFLSLINSTLAETPTNIRIEPLSLLVGTLAVQADFGISPHWTLGPSVRYLKRTIGDFDATAYSAGIRGNYYFDREVMTQGWYLSPELSLMRVSVVENDNNGPDAEASATGFAITGLGGYQWMWENFNIMLGIGPVFYGLGDIETKDSSGNKETFSGFSTVGLALDFSLGWKF